jgi:hypothetical protein
VPKDGDEVDAKEKDSVQDIKLAFDERGFPLLPPWESVKNKKLLYKKMLIGKFASEVYRELDTVLFFNLCLLHCCRNLHQGKGEDPLGHVERVPGQLHRPDVLARRRSTYPVPPHPAR